MLASEVMEMSESGQEWVLVSRDIRKQPLPEKLRRRRAQGQYNHLVLLGTTRDRIVLGSLEKEVRRWDGSRIFLLHRCCTIDTLGLAAR
jgi:hypothetical protein